ncbi:MAG: hypothetical protein QXW83_04440 [Nitrososphaerales archaeon]
MSELIPLLYESFQAVVDEVYDFIITLEVAVPPKVTVKSITVTNVTKGKTFTFNAMTSTWDTRPYAKEGDKLTFKCDIKNTGGAGKCWVRWIDVSTGTQLDRTEVSLGENESATLGGALQFTMPNKNWTIRLEAGHG